MGAVAVWCVGVAAAGSLTARTTGCDAGVVAPVANLSSIVTTTVTILILAVVCTVMAIVLVLLVAGGLSSGAAGWVLHCRVVVACASRGGRAGCRSLPCVVLGVHCSCL